MSQPAKRKQYRPKKSKDEVSHYDLRREELWNNYSDPTSPTFNNVLRSAIRAGYSESTARVIAQEPWFIKRRENFVQLLPKAEENILECLNLDTKIPVLINQELTYKHDHALLRIKHDASTFVAETVGRQRFSKKLTLQHSGKVSLLNESLDQVFDEEGKD